MADKTSLPTKVVLRARQMYVQRLQDAVKTYGSPPYMTAKVDPRTTDRQIGMMTTDDMAALAQNDPVRAEQVAKRAEQLRQRAEQNAPPFSAPGEFEVNDAS